MSPKSTCNQSMMEFLKTTASHLKFAVLNNIFAFIPFMVNTFHLFTNTWWSNSPTMWSEQALIVILKHSFLNTLHPIKHLVEPILLIGLKENVTMSRMKVSPLLYLPLYTNLYEIYCTVKKNKSISNTQQNWYSVAILILLLDIKPIYEKNPLGHM